MKFSKTKLLILSVVMSILLIPATAYASPAELAAEKEAVLQDINLNQLELDKLSNDYGDALIQKTYAEQELEETNKRIKETQKELQKAKDKMSFQCTTLYKQDQASMMGVILNSNSFDNFVSNIDYYNRFIDQSDKTIKKIKKMKKSLKEQKIKQTEKKKELSNLLIRISEDQAIAEARMQELQQQYNQLDTKYQLALLEMTPITQVYEEIVEENDPLEMTEYIEEQVEEAIARGEQGDIVSRAYSQLGADYVWGGTTSAGFDCSGFVSYCLTGQEGTRLGTTATFINWTQVDDPQPGDVCVVHNGNHQHTGVYVGDGNMVHASTYGVGVVESPVQDDMIYVRYNG